MSIDRTRLRLRCSRASSSVSTVSGRTPRRNDLVHRLIERSGVDGRVGGDEDHVEIFPTRPTARRAQSGPWQQDRALMVAAKPIVDLVGQYALPAHSSRSSSSISSSVHLAGRGPGTPSSLAPPLAAAGICDRGREPRRAVLAQPAVGGKAPRGCSRNSVWRISMSQRHGASRHRSPYPARSMRRTSMRSLRSTIPRVAINRSCGTASKQEAMSVMAGLGASRARRPAGADDAEEQHLHRGTCGGGKRLRRTGRSADVADRAAVNVIERELSRPARGTVAAATIPSSSRVRSPSAAAPAQQETPEANGVVS
jgi:hypothetical protein